MKTNCCICNEISSGIIDSKLSNYSPVKERFLWRTNNFVAVPSVSPLSIDHFLIFPKIHISSLAQLNDCLFKEFKDFANQITEDMSNQYSELIMFEHGVGKGQQGGCGIDHAHLHILPCSKELFDNTINELINQFGYPTSTRLKKINSISENSNYIIIGNNVDNIYLFENYYFESQTIRKILCKFLDINSWDWKELTNKNLFEQTISNWQHAH
jgi:ATP adenylyltransferase